MIYQTEQQLVDSIEKYLSQWFHIQREVWSDCGKGRIDMIVECKLTAIRLGIEAKLNDKKRGEKIAEHIRQSIRYSQMTFNGSQIPIFIAPQISSDYLAIVEDRKLIDGIEWIRDRHGPQHEHHTANGFLGDFNVGELRSIKGKIPYWCFTFSNNPIYSMKKRWNSNDIIGLHRENYTNLLRKIQEWKL